jgi:hypothetical protein
MFKVTGFDKLQRDLMEAKTALRGLSGNIAQLKYDTGDRHSVAAAVREMERAIDRKVGRFRGNPFVANLANQLKASYRNSILKNSDEARRGRR